MKTLIFIICLLFPFKSYTQSIIWERELNTYEYLATSLFPSIIDSDGNVVTLIDEGTFGCFRYHFVKYNKNGELLSWKPYTVIPPLAPMSLYETSFGYKVFSFIMADYSKNVQGLPMIINLSKIGDTINFVCPYDIYIDSNISKYATKYMLFQYNNNSTYNNGLFFNAIIKDQIRIDTNTYLERQHLIVQAYDTVGKNKWRFGIDTIKTNGNYYFWDMKLSSDNNIIILSSLLPNTSDIKSQIMQIIKIDSNGNIIKKIEYPVIKRPFAPRAIVESNNSDLIILCQDLNTLGYFLTILDSNGKFLNFFEIPTKNDKLQLYRLKKTPNGNFLVFGKTFIEKTQSKGYNTRNIIFNINSDFVLKSYLEWYEHPNDSGSTSLVDILFIDNKNFIGIGYKDNTKFYIAKFVLDSITGVSEPSERGSKKVISLIITPNPATDYIEINLNNRNLKDAVERVKVYDVLGNVVVSLGDSRFRGNDIIVSDEGNVRLDISMLAPGVYFIKVGDIVSKFVKM